MGNCWKCKYKGNIPGDRHVRCFNPPAVVAYIGACGPGMGGTFDDRGAPNFETSEERQAWADKAAADDKVVVRCVWPGSGIYPIVFDANTVFACCNFEGEE